MINFPFGTNGKYIIFRCPNSEAVLILGGLNSDILLLLPVHSVELKFHSYTFYSL